MQLFFKISPAHGEFLGVKIEFIIRNHLYYPILSRMSNRLRLVVDAAVVEVSTTTASTICCTTFCVCIFSRIFSCYSLSLFDSELMMGDVFESPQGLVHQPPVRQDEWQDSHRSFRWNKVQFHWRIAELFHICKVRLWLLNLSSLNLTDWTDRNP